MDEEDGRKDETEKICRVWHQPLDGWASPVASVVKNLLPMQTWAPSLGGEIPGEGTATRSSVLARTIPWAEEPGEGTATRSSTLAWTIPRTEEPGEGMATRSSTLAWTIPWAEEPGGLQSTGSQRVEHS